MPEIKLKCECGKEMIEVKSEYEEFEKQECPSCKKGMYIIKRGEPCQKK